MRDIHFDVLLAGFRHRPWEMRQYHLGLTNFRLDRLLRRLADGSLLYLSLDVIRHDVMIPRNQCLLARIVCLVGPEVLIVCERPILRVIVKQPASAPQPIDIGNGVSPVDIEF